LRKNIDVAHPNDKIASENGYEETKTSAKIMIN